MNPDRQRRPTLFDVAEAAGVSHQTVSRYLRVPETLKPATFAKVKAAVEELAYQPNVVARSMRARRTDMLAIVMPGHTMPYSPARVLASATRVAHSEGFQVEIMAVEGGAAERSTRTWELISGGLFTGVLAIADVWDADSIRSRGTLEVAPIYDDDLNGVGPLLDASPIREIVQRMVELGHRSFLHIGGPEKHPASIERKRVFLDTLHSLGLTPVATTSGPWDGEYARDAVLALPGDSEVTAIVAGNDELAAGAIAGASMRGWDVPGRVSVSGWDDNPVGALMPPALSTVRVDHASLGEAAMKRLISKVRGTEPATEDERPLNTVIWRASVAAAPSLTSAGTLT